MAPTSTIESWPPEVFECTAKQLALADLCSLRLVSKAIAVLVAQDTFKQYYRTKRVDLSPESLTEFVHMTRSGVLGVDVENLVLTGLAVDTEYLEKIVKEKARWETEGNGPMFCSTQHKLSDAEHTEAKQSLEELYRRKADLEQFHRSGRDVELLVQAFSNIAAHALYGRLPSLKLEVALSKDDLGKKLLPIQTRSRSTVWRAGEATFGAAVGGLAGSGMPLEKLDVMTDQWHCSLCSEAMGYVQQLRGSGLEQALSRLESLSLSLSADMKIDKEKEGEERTDPEKETLRTDVLADFLALCPQLTHLHLHWFLLRSAGYDNLLAEDLLEQATKSQALSTLTSLTLRGLRFKGPTLLDLLKSAPIRELRLENIRISDPEPLPADHDDESDPENPSPANSPEPEAVTSHAWNMIFTHCNSVSADMSSVYFDDLWGSRLLHFKNVPGGRPKMPWTPHTGGCETLAREGREKVRKEIEYAYARGRPLGSPQAYRWWVGREREYGPA